MIIGRVGRLGGWAGLCAASLGAESLPYPRRMGSPTAIEVRHVAKGFDVQGRDRRSVRESLVHPLRRTRGRRLDVLDDISFDVARGEFFGIVGRNGSGKSTLLKMLASIYRADRGSIRLAGRIAPFIELGVGFNPELGALDNVTTNGVMMGLTPAEARGRFDEIISFAGLEDYTDLKLKNYSSGMKVRLGFSVMAHVDADILLIDEVLAVGDASFQAKCGDVFNRLHAEGKTLILVTHSMPMIEGYCERAMVIHNGVVDQIGDAHSVASRYLELNVTDLMQETAGEAVPSLVEDGRLPARVVDVWFEGEAAGSGTAQAGSGPLEVCGIVEVDHPVDRPAVLVEIQPSQRRVKVFSSPIRPLEASPERALSGERLRFRATIENRLTPGSYQVRCALATSESATDRPVILAAPRSLPLEVAGPGRSAGLVSLEHELALWHDAPVEAMPE
jgi:ABC-type polysaccharide/polyol phosphate transport system ATPase subunit